MLGNGEVISGCVTPDDISDDQLWKGSAHEQDSRGDFDGLQGGWGFWVRMSGAPKKVGVHIPVHSSVHGPVQSPDSSFYTIPKMPTVTLMRIIIMCTEG